MQSEVQEGGGQNHDNFLFGKFEGSPFSNLPMHLNFTFLLILELL
jgi:hypothetical protein